MLNRKFGNDLIPQVLYDQTVEHMPVASVEALVVSNGELLLMRRKNEPVSGEWWFPGGRIRLGETFQEALKREVKEETGLTLSRCKFIKAYSRVFPERHDITIAFLCTCRKGRIVLNNEHSEYAFFRKMPAGLHPYLRISVRDSGWKDWI